MFPKEGSLPAVARNGSQKKLGHRWTNSALAPEENQGSPKQASFSPGPCTLGGRPGIWGHLCIRKVGRGPFLFCTTNGKLLNTLSTDKRHWQTKLTGLSQVAHGQLGPEVL